MYQVQRGLLRRRAEQLALERRTLRERIDKLIRLLPGVAPHLKQLPQWSQLDSEQSASRESPFDNKQEPVSLDFDSDVIQVLLEISSDNVDSAVEVQPNHPAHIDPFQSDDTSHTIHENFHPCQLCSGRLITV